MSALQYICLFNVVLQAIWDDSISDQLEVSNTDSKRGKGEPSVTFIKGILKAKRPAPDVLLAAVLVQHLIDATYIFLWTAPGRPAARKVATGTSAKLCAGLRTILSKESEDECIVLALHKRDLDPALGGNQNLSNLHDSLAKSFIQLHDGIVSQLAPVAAYESLEFYHDYASVLPMILNNSSVLAGVIIVFNMLRQVGAVQASNLPVLNEIVRLFRNKVFGGDYLPMNLSLLSWGSTLGGTYSAKDKGMLCVPDTFDIPKRLVDVSFSHCLTYPDGRALVDEHKVRCKLTPDPRVITTHSDASTSTQLKAKFCPPDVLVQAANDIIRAENKPNVLDVHIDGIAIYRTCIATFARLFELLVAAGPKEHRLPLWKPDADHSVYSELDVLSCILNRVDALLRCFPYSAAARNDGAVAILRAAVLDVWNNKVIHEFQTPLDLALA